MAISHAIAHRISRNAPTAEVNVQLREKALALNGRIEECLRDLKLSYVKKLGKIHGRFSPNTAEHPLSSWVQQCVEEKLSFVSLTHRAMQHFKLCIEKTEAVVDALVFFVQEHFEHTDDFYIFCAFQNQALYLDGELCFTDTFVFDPTSLFLAAKLNLSEWLSEDQHLNYLSLLPWRGEKEISDAFVACVGLSDKADIKQETEIFLEAVDTFTTQLAENEAYDTREKVVSYCLDQDKQGRRVNFAELTQELAPAQQQAFRAHLQKATPQLKEEFIPDRTQMRQYIRISGRNELLSMSFDSKCLGQSIVYNPSTDSLTITQLPSALKTRLMKHLKGEKE